ncbi:MAG: hypothetical protein ACI4SE_03945 [Lachnospiraceae bacterium]
MQTYDPALYQLFLGELPSNHFAEFKINSSLFTLIISKKAEQKQYEQLENGKCKKHLEVVAHTKSDAGYRTLYVVSSAMESFDKVNEANLRNGYSCEAEDYIFMYRKHRITANSIDSHYGVTASR